ncbi:MULTISPECIES: hypothetical protein [unclassified Nostoc]|uniref:hypothetical protein n=1 Tax=unclassified Nostoc TaxID=2593658 RepID=UPI002AD85596|nr:hypothetical protein [Nostoc sp. DedQUE02]
MTKPSLKTGCKKLQFQHCRTKTIAYLKGVAELKYEFGCRDVALLRLYKDFGIMQNPTSYMESATPLKSSDRFFNGYHLVVQRKWHIFSTA